MSTDFERFETFMNVALSRTSTISEPDSNITLGDIAFVVDYLKVVPKEVEKVKREIVQKTPIIALVHTLATVQTDIDVGETLRTLSTATDAQARVQLQKQLYYLENIIFAAVNAKVKTDTYRTKVWRMFTGVLNDPLRKLPLNVSTQIQNAIIKQRCGMEPTFLKQTNKTLGDFNEIFIDSPLDAEYVDHPLNSKNRLCPIIRDLNTMADTGLTSEIRKCVKLLNNYTPGDLDLTSDSVEYRTIKTEVDTFKRWVIEWENLESYACVTENCTTKAARLKEAADAVRKYAHTCSASIKKRHKNNLRRRKKNKDTTLTLREKISTWF
jgi:hypothetical protein